MSGLNTLTQDLDDQQRQAVLAPRGPVCILAGAGTGKTRTITRRIAALVANGHVAPKQILAVSFTKRAADEMGVRLTQLDNQISSGVGTVYTSTFHAAALRQLSYFWPHQHPQRSFKLCTAFTEISKERFLYRAAQRLNLDLTPEQREDIGQEIGLAKSCLIHPQDYQPHPEHNTHSLDPEDFIKLYQCYEHLKNTKSVVYLDYEDLLAHTIAILETSSQRQDEFRERYRCFIIDEYQDISPLQQRLLDAWLGERDNITVVGDPHQTIYSFSGANPTYLLNFPRRFPHHALIRLTHDYRSSPQIVNLANQVISATQSKLVERRSDLISQQPPGPIPTLRHYHDEHDEVQATLEMIIKLLHTGIPSDQIAILYRTHSQAHPYEQALQAAGIPYTDQAQSEDHSAIALLSLHTAKGLEWDSVFLVGLTDTMLPFHRTHNGDLELLEEERRLLYVGITRARTYLSLSWSTYSPTSTTPRQLCRFLTSLASGITTT